MMKLYNPMVFQAAITAFKLGAQFINTTPVFISVYIILLCPAFDADVTPV